MISDMPERLSDEGFKKEVDRIASLLRECLNLNNCMEWPALSALMGVVLNTLLKCNYTYDMMVVYFEKCMDHARPFFEEKR